MLVRMNAELCELMGGFFSLLAHPTRIRIFCALQHGPQTVSALAEKSHVSLPNASQHLRVMQKNGALTKEKRGQQVFYQIADPRFVQAAEMIRDALVENVQCRARRASHGTTYRKALRQKIRPPGHTMLALATNATDKQNSDSVLPLLKKEFLL